MTTTTWLWILAGIAALVGGFTWSALGLGREADDAVEMNDDRRRYLIVAHREQTARMGGF